MVWHIGGHVYLPSGEEFDDKIDITQSFVSVNVGIKKTRKKKLLVWLCQNNLPVALKLIN